MKRQVVSTRFSKNEMGVIRAAAAATGLSLSRWIREALQRQVMHQTPHEQAVMSRHISDHTLANFVETTVLETYRRKHPEMTVKVVAAYRRKHPELMAALRLAKSRLAKSASKK